MGIIPRGIGLVAALLGASGPRKTEEPADAPRSALRLRQAPRRPPPKPQAPEGRPQGSVCQATHPAARIPSEQGECGECEDERQHGERLGALEDQRDRAHAAIEEIAARGCEGVKLTLLSGCREHDLDRSKWCNPCIAADAKEARRDEA